MKEKIIEQNSLQGHCGIVQLRCTNGLIAQEMLGFTRKVAASRTGGSEITKITKSKQGYDVYIATRGTLNRIIRELPQRFGGRVTLTRRLITVRRQTSKRVYRFFALLWAFPFRAGDLIEIDGRPIRLTNVSKRITGLDISTGKRISFNYTPETKIKPLEPHIALVSSHKPKLMLIHPLTYQPVAPKNSPSAVRESYKVVIVGKSLYCLNEQP